MVVVTSIVMMVRGRAPDLTLFAAVVVLIVCGVISPASAVSGFGNEGLISVAALCIVGAGLQNTGAIRFIAAVVERPGISLRGALLRICAPISAASAFLNNTPLVAVMTPTLIEIGKRQKVSPSKLLMPMCFATTLGGTLTIIGTSTNLVVLGLVDAAAPTNPALRTIGFFELAWIGLPLALVGVCYLLLAAPLLIPDRVPVIEPLTDPREYTARLGVARGGPLEGRTIAEAGLRRLEGLFVVAIERSDESIAAPGPSHTLRGGDFLVFAGAVEQIVHLRSVAGLVSEIEAKEPALRRGRRMLEAVVSNSFPGIGQSIRGFGFRSRYDAAVIAVARNGQRISGRIGDIVLQSGDTLLLETGEHFLAQHRNSRDFFLISPLATQARRPHRAGIAAGILLLMIVAATVTGSMLAPALAAAIAMVVTGCLRGSDARSAIDIPIVIVIGSGLALSQAVSSSGLGQMLGKLIVEIGAGSPLASLACVYLGTALLTAFVSNAAAAAIMFPLALGTAAHSQSDPMAFVFAVMFAASAVFSTPVGYQTNLMVYGPGGYRFSDFVRFGLPLNLLAFLVTMIGLAWQFNL